jgi:hypothetical protein
MKIPQKIKADGFILTQEKNHSPSERTNAKDCGSFGVPLSPEAEGELGELLKSLGGASGGSRSAWSLPPPAFVLSSMGLMSDPHLVLLGFIPPHSSNFSLSLAL